MTTSQWIKVETSDGSYDAFLAVPKVGSGAGILLVQEIFGVNEHIQEVAKQYAEDGFTVLAPDLFWRSEPRVELVYEGDDLNKGVDLMMKTNFSAAVADLGRAAEFLATRPECSGAVTAMGFCFGGRLAFNLLVNKHVSSAVCYYGGGLENDLQLVEPGSKPVLFHYAGEDPHIPQESVSRVREAFADQKNSELFVYEGSQHGFNCSHRGSYNQKSAALAHGRTLQFLAGL